VAAEERGELVLSRRVGGHLDLDMPHGSPEMTPAVGESSHPGSSSDPRHAISKEFHAIRQRAEGSALKEQSKARWWARLYFVVGLPAAVLAAIAGATALASTADHVVAGVIALIAAGLTAAATFLDSGTRRSAHENLAAAWQALANDLHVSSTVDIHDDEWLQRYARLHLQDVLDRERKLLQGKAPDAEAEAERRAQAEALHAQEAAARARAEAERARAAEQEARAEARRAQALAARISPEQARDLFP
jgi:hypothetical protein